ncbi:peptidylprolyl isomerase [Pelagimonas varians]|uniref:Parvulin-like PPIase n=1 Tax=Pelagimonas varians TaxID=696760 RepID=A0A238JUV2_9RHOB|nr:peptidylprolyl isomerase [Pelagimonas varians]PYG34560.1 periplasmic chaperone for outer membrane proteins SurA [Pelagimonas varians]SMX33526.1 Chaperone SurA precursor [Pelagimonas varians]
MRPLTRILSPLALVATLAFTPAMLPAQGLFSPAILVNDQAITGYELQQRAEMLKLMRAPGNPLDGARDQLIDDRLRIQAARDAGIRPTDEEVLDGMAEFASRSNMSREDFVQALGAAGVEEQTFRDFVRSGLSWRLLVQQRFAGRSGVTETEVDRALSKGGGSNIRVLISEIIMPVPPGQETQLQQRAERIAELTSVSAFSAQARRYSATATRGNGGRMPWRDLADLPPQLQPLLLGLRPGEVTDPLPLEGAIALFQLREIEESDYTPPEISAIEYAAYYMPGGQSDQTMARARVLKNTVDRCDDLYGVAKGQPAEVLQRDTLPPADIPTDVAYELSKLDPGEVSTALTRANGQTLVFLMLCGRTSKIAEEVDREQVIMGLRNQRVGSLADGYLAQLRADARIIVK